MTNLFYDFSKNKEQIDSSFSVDEKTGMITFSFLTPGIPRENLKLTYNQNKLTLTAKTKEGFERKSTFGIKLDIEITNAKYTNGELIVTAKQKEDQHKTQIEIH